jgi:hypothetical protein
MLSCTMGSQKVPGMVVLQYNGNTPFAFKAGPLRIHTLAPPILTVLEVGIFQSLAAAFDLVSSMVGKRVPLGPIPRVGNSRKSLGARSGEYGGRVMTQQAMCGSVRCRDAEATVPACLPLPLQTLLVEVASNTLPRRYELKVHQIVDVK